MLTADDIMEIHQVLNRYHHLVDNHDWNALGQIFSEDAVYDLSYRGHEPVEGLDAIASLMARSLETEFNTQTGQHGTNIFVFEDSDGTVRSEAKTLTILADGRALSADYHDILTRTESGWRICRRTPSSRDPSAASWTKLSPSS
jgi:ketosteroid isomerase-like protein